MGDIAEAKFEEDDENNRRVSVMQRLNTTIGKAKSKALQEELLNQSEHQKLIQKTLKRKSKLPQELRKLTDNDREEMVYYQNWLSSRSSNLEKLHFIIGHGILKPALRFDCLALKRWSKVCNVHVIIGTRFTVNCASNCRTIHIPHRMQRDGFCCHCALDVSLLPNDSNNIFEHFWIVDPDCMLRIARRDFSELFR